MVVCQESDLLFFQSSRKKTPEDTNSTGYTGNISEPDMLRWRTDFAEHESIGFAGIIHVEINTGLLRDITSLLVRSRNKPWKGFRMKVLWQKNKTKHTGSWDWITVELWERDPVHIWAKVLLWRRPWKQTLGSPLPRAAEAAVPEQSGCEPKQIQTVNTIHHFSCSLWMRIWLVSN